MSRYVQEVIEEKIQNHRAQQDSISVPLSEAEEAVTAARLRRDVLVERHKRLSAQIALLRVARTQLRDAPAVAPCGVEEVQP